MLFASTLYLRGVVPGVDLVESAQVRLAREDVQLGPQAAIGWDCALTEEKAHVM